MEKVGIIVTDTCPGIQDNVVPITISLSMRKNITRSRKGPGLFVVRSRVEICGRRIWVGDIFPGKVGTGTAIHFLLKKTA